MRTTSRIPLFLSALLIIAITSCKKDKTDHTSQEITIGSTDGMYVRYLNHSVEGGYNEPDIFELDLNNDGIDDVRFSSNLAGSLGMGYHPRSSMAPMHDDIEFFGFNQLDSIYSFNGYDTLTGGPDVIITELNITTCNNSSAAHVFSHMQNRFEFGLLSNGDVLSKLDDFSSYTLNFNSISSPSFPVNQNQDTLWYVSNGSNLGCYQYQGGSYHLFGVKLKLDYMERIGWIKLLVTQDYKIKIAEFALQE